MTQIPFEFPEDSPFFEDLLVIDEDDHISNYSHFFDFRAPEIKRKEFNKIRNAQLKTLLENYGERCLLNFEICDINSGFAVDHLIPLSSNKINKNIRKLKAEKGRKVKTQSFGSNHPDNLIIACAKCNNHKKHRFLTKTQYHEIFSMKSELS